MAQQAAEPVTQGRGFHSSPPALEPQVKDNMGDCRTSENWQCTTTHSLMDAQNAVEWEYRQDTPEAVQIRQNV